MNIPRLLFQQATVGVHYVYQCQFVVQKKTKFDYTIVLAYIKNLSVVGDLLDSNFQLSAEICTVLSL